MDDFKSLLKEAKQIWEFDGFGKKRTIFDKMQFLFSSMMFLIILIPTVIYFLITTKDNKDEHTTRK